MEEVIFPDLKKENGKPKNWTGRIIDEAVELVVLKLQKVGRIEIDEENIRQVAQQIASEEKEAWKNALAGAEDAEFAEENRTRELSAKIIGRMQH